jgi:hypothetical protein
MALAASLREHAILGGGIEHRHCPSITPGEKCGAAEHALAARPIRQSGRLAFQG